MIVAIDPNGNIVWWYGFGQKSADPSSLCHHDGTLWMSTEISDIYGVAVTNGRETVRYESASPISSPKMIDGDRVVTLKTYEHFHFDGHKQWIENFGEVNRLDI